MEEHRPHDDGKRSSPVQQSAGARDAAAGGDRGLGERLVAAGVLTRRQLADALDVYETLAALGEPRPLGEVLVALGYLRGGRAGWYVPPAWVYRLRQVARTGGAAEPHYDDALVARLTGCLRRLERLFGRITLRASP